MELPKSHFNNDMIKYRGKTNSGDLVDFIKNSIYDINKLYSILNKNTIELQEMNSITSIENLILFSHLLQLEDIIKQKDELLAPNSNKFKNINVRNIIGLEEYTSISISQEYNQFSIGNLNYRPKLYIEDKILNKNIISKDITINTETRYFENEINITENLLLDDIIIRENDQKKLIDGNINTCYQKIIEVPNNITSIEMDIEVNIPSNIISNRLINTLMFTPHPIKNVDVVDILIKVNNIWERIPTFDDHSKYIDNAIPNSPPLRFMFNDLTITSFKIKLRQKNPIINGNKNIFYIGGYNLDIGYSSTLNTESYFACNFELLGNTNIINNITPLLDNKSINFDLTYDIYYLNESDQPILLSDSLPITIPNNKLYIIGIIHKHEIIPLLNSIKIEYEAL